MAAITRQFEGQDIVITCAELRSLGVELGQWLAIRPLKPIRLIESPAADHDRRLAELRALWGRTDADAECDEEALYEATWSAWSGHSA